VRVDLQRAETFIWQNARLLERHLYAFHFMGGSREAVINALRVYQNPDGGFGNALEPDLRCPDSQPVPVLHALRKMDQVGFDDAIVQRASDYLMTITTEEGGVPWMLPSAHALSQGAVVEYGRDPDREHEPHCGDCGTPPQESGSARVGGRCD